MSWCRYSSPVEKVLYLNYVFCVCVLWVGVWGAGGATGCGDVLLSPWAVLPVWELCGHRSLDPTVLLSSPPVLLLPVCVCSAFSRTQSPIGSNGPNTALRPHSLSLSLSLSHSFTLSVSLSVALCLALSMYLSLSLSIFLSFCLSVFFFFFTG